MSTTIAAPAVSNIESISTAALALPGASFFPFLNVENLHHRLRASVQTRIETIRQEEARINRERAAKKQPLPPLPPRGIFLASRRQICGDTAAAQHLVDALHQLNTPILLLINEQTFTVEVIDPHKCGHLDRLRSCGKHSR